MLYGTAKIMVSSSKLLWANYRIPDKREYFVIIRDNFFLFCIKHML